MACYTKSSASRLNLSPILATLVRIMDLIHCKSCTKMLRHWHPLSHCAIEAFMLQVLLLTANGC